MKLLEENIGRPLFDTNCSNIFFDLSPKAKEIEALPTKQNKTKQKWDLTGLTSFCKANETIDKIKRQSTEWGKYFI